MARGEHRIEPMKKLAIFPQRLIQGSMYYSMSPAHT